MKNCQLLDLNDDCLVKIFTNLSLNQRLELVGNICRRIDDIVYKSLLSLKSLNVNLRNPPEFSLKHLDIISPNIRHLSIAAGYALPTILTLNILQPICAHKALQSLTLHYVHFNEDYMNCVLNVAEQLKSLDLSYCQLTDALVAPILENAINLQTLTLFGNTNLKYVSLRSIRSQHLREIKVEKNYVCRDEIEKFNENNNHVRVVVFNHGYLGHARDLP